MRCEEWIKMSYMGKLAIKVLNEERERDIGNLIDKIKKDVSNMTSKQLQDWCNSQECYDYLNR